MPDPFVGADPGASNGPNQRRGPAIPSFDLSIGDPRTGHSGALPALSVEARPSRLRVRDARAGRQHRPIEGLPQVGMPSMDASDPWRQRRGSRTRWGLVLFFVLLCAAIAIMAAERVRIVGYIPQLAPYYDRLGMPVPDYPGLVLSDVRLSKVEEDGTPIALVSGRVKNTALFAQAVPTVKFSLLDAEERILLQVNLDPQVRKLEPDGETGVVYRFVNPPTALDAVEARFGE